MPSFTTAEWFVIAAAIAFPPFLIWSLIRKLRDVRSEQQADARTPGGRLILYGLITFAVLAALSYTTGTAAATPFRVAMIGLVIVALVRDWKGRRQTG
jgi:hypothetical protein